MTTTRSLYTRCNYQVNQTPTWKMLSNDQCEDIYLTAVELLERTGVDIYSAEALDILAGAGCWIDGNRARFPGHLIEQAVQAAPRRVTLCNRGGQRALRLEATNVYCGPGANNKMLVDPASGELRQAVKNDVASTAKVCDALKNIDFVMSNGIPSDVSPALSKAYAFEALVTNTAKPIVQDCGSVAEMQDIIDMAAAVAGDLDKLQQNPFLALQVATEGGLIHSAAALEQVICAAKNSIPLIYNTQVVAGVTAPASVAGALVVALADVLVGVVLSQQVRSGAPVIAGGFLTIRDEGCDKSYGAPELSMLATGLANVLRYIGLPSFSSAGGTDAKLSDSQMGMELAFSLLHAGLGGINVINGCGQLESGKTGSLEMIVMSDEVMGMVKRILRGIEVNEERLARGVVDRVSPGGHYLGEDHTMKFFRKEFWWPTLMSRNRFKDWEALGSKSLGQRVHEKTETILSTHTVEQLPEATLARLKEILDKAEARKAAK